MVFYSSKRSWVKGLHQQCSDSTNESAEVSVYYPWSIGGNEIPSFFTFGNNSKPGWYSTWISGE
jgi:hypothetical protein